MAKTKELKKQILKDLESFLSTSKTTVFADYSGTSVGAIRELRKEARENKLKIKIAKNSLLKKALEKNSLTVSSEILNKPLILAFDENDEVSPAKVVYEKTKTIETIKILGAIVNGEFFGPDKVESLAKMPSREILYAKLVGTINAPISGFVNVLAGNLRGLINVLNAKKQKMEETK